jgi:Uma2 family endonuclease
MICLIPDSDDLLYYYLIAPLGNLIMTQAIITTSETSIITIASEEPISKPEAQILWTSADLDLLPKNSKRYEIIDGELYVTRFFTVLDIWSRATNLGEAEIGAGLIFGDNDDVIPDVIWMSKEKYVALIDDTGHFHGAPDLVIEVLSAGTENEKRDREVKLKLYSNQGVLEYWIADWRNKQIQVYRRENGVLKLVMTLFETDTLTSPLLPEFSCLISQIFE